MAVPVPTPPGRPSPPEPWCSSGRAGTPVPLGLGSLRYRTVQNEANLTVIHEASRQAGAGGGATIAGVDSDHVADLAPLTGAEREWCRRVRDSGGARSGSQSPGHIAPGRATALWECWPAPAMAESLDAHVACLPLETQANPARARGILHAIAWATGRASAPITARSPSGWQPSAQEMEDEQIAAAMASAIGIGVEARHFLSGVVACLIWLRLPDGMETGITEQ